MSIIYGPVDIDELAIRLCAAFDSMRNNIGFKAAINLRKKIGVHDFYREIARQVVLNEDKKEEEMFERKPDFGKRVPSKIDPPIESS